MTLLCVAEKTCSVSEHNTFVEVAYVLMFCEWNTAALERSVLTLDACHDAQIDVSS